MVPDLVEVLVRVARPAGSRSADHVSHEDAYSAYCWCAQLLTPDELAQAVQRYCEGATPKEQVALARLLRRGFALLADPAVRVWMRVDPWQASAAQVAHLHAIAHQRYPYLLDLLFQPVGQFSGPEAQRAVTGIATEAAQDLLGRWSAWDRSRPTHGSPLSALQACS